MNEVIKYDPDKNMWYLVRDGLKVAVSQSSQTLIRRFPEARVEER